MIAKSDLNACREQLEERLGERIMLKSNGGRRRTVIHEGYLENCSANVFTVRCPVSPTYSEHVCFSYIDLLTKVVEIAFDDDELERLLQSDGR
ncbi:MAG: Veg family protein [Saccharofermentanales bacterium]